MEPPPYTVLVPYYAGPQHLRQALLSVVAQSDDDWVAVVVDDSPGGGEVGPIIDDLADPRISWSRNDSTLGVAGNFNRCFDVARARGAELAVILHADDELEPHYVATMRAVHHRCPDAPCAVPKATVIDADGNPTSALADTVKAWLWPDRVGQLAGSDGLRRLMHGQFFHCPAVSYRLALVADPAWNERWRQVMDLELYAEVLLKGQAIVLEPGTLFRYRRHTDQATERNSGELLRTVEETELCRAIATRAAALGWRRAAWAARWRVTVRLQALVRAGGFVWHKHWRLAGRATLLALRP